MATLTRPAPKELTAEQKAAVKAEYASLAKLSKATIIELVQANHRIFDTKGLDKSTAIAYLLQDKFGRNAHTAWS